MTSQQQPRPSQAISASLSPWQVLVRLLCLPCFRMNLQNLLTIVDAQILRRLFFFTIFNSQTHAMPSSWSGKDGDLL